VAVFAGLSALLAAVLPEQDMVVGTLITLIAALLAGWVLLKFVEKKPLAALGFGITPRTRREIGAGLAIPMAALLAVTLLLIVFGALRYRDDAGGLREWLAGNIGFLLVLAVPAAAEEALFRGYPFQKLVQMIGPVAATVLASAGFAIAHRHNPGVNAFALVNIFLAGLMLSIAYLRTGSLWFATAVHLGWNWQMAGPLDLPVSGLELFDTPMYEPHELGTPWLTGGGFGPEGGVAGLVALLLVTAAVWLFTKQNDAQA
jgi:membrane protease YdiL (CAAX protease family)